MKAVKKTRNPLRNPFTVRMDAEQTTRNMVVADEASGGVRLNLRVEQFAGHYWIQGARG